jgi:hypothetical protein
MLLMIDHREAPPYLIVWRVLRHWACTTSIVSVASFTLDTLAGQSLPSKEHTDTSTLDRFDRRRQRTASAENVIYTCRPLKAFPPNPFVSHIIKQAIELVLCPNNMNREDGVITTSKWVRGKIISV